MANRAKNAQYAYGITIEAGNYNEVINGFEKRLKSLDKVTATTTKTFAALSEEMKSGKQVDFSKAEGQLTGLVAEMEEVAKWREQLAGGQKLSDMFDGLDQVKQQLGQVTGQLDKFGANIEEIFSILQNVPQNTSKTFVDVRKVLQRQASDMNKIIAELNNPTEKTDVSGLKNQLSSIATDFVNEWNKAASQGIKMDQVVDFKPFATIIKNAISGARSLGAEFNDVSASVTEATKNVVALYSVKHPTGMFKDISAGMSGIEVQSKKAEQSVTKFSSTFKAAIGIAEQFGKSDMGLAKKSKELEEFLTKLKNPEITIDINDGNVKKEFQALEEKFDSILGGNSVTPDFLSSLNIEELKNLANIIQNIIAIGKKYPKELDIDFGRGLFGAEKDSIGELDAYGTDLKKIISEIKEQLDEANAQISESVKTLKSQLEALGLKDIELNVKLVDLTGDKVEEYVEQLNKFVDDLTGKLKNKGAIELPVDIKIPGITPAKTESKEVKDSIKSALDEYKRIIEDVGSTEEKKQDTRNKITSKIISGAFGSNESLDLYLNYIKEQFSKIRETIRRQKKEIQDMLSLDFSWNKDDAANSFSNLFVELQDYFSDPENAIKVEIDKKYLVDRIKDAFSAGGVDLKLSSSGTPMDQSQLAAAIISAFGGSLPTTKKVATTATKQTTSSSSQSPVAENDVKSRFVFNIKEFMSKYSGELSEGLNETLKNIVESVRDVAKNANGSKVNKEVRAKIQAAFGSLDLSKVAQMTDDEIISWVQNALLKADESGRAVGADLPKALNDTKVSWKSISNFSNALKQLFIKIEDEVRDVQGAARDRQNVAVLKDFGYRARAIDSRSSVLRKLNKNEIDEKFLTSQLDRLESVRTYKESLPDKGSGIVKWLEKAIGIYQKLINISNGETTFDTEAEKQEEIAKLREELSKIRVSDDRQLIETLAGEITVSKKYKNGTKSRGQRREFSGSSRGLERALSLIEKAGDDGVITIRFTSTPNDKAMREWIETENEYGKEVKAPRHLRDGSLRGEGKSSLISGREDRKNLLQQEIDFKPFSQSRKPIDWEEYESDLQKRLQENEDALNEQQKIVDEARKSLSSASRKKSSADKRVLSYTDNHWIDVGEDILKIASEDENSGLNDKSIKQLSKLVRGAYNKDSKKFKKAYAQAEKDLNALMSEEASEDNVAKIKSLLDFIKKLNEAAEKYSSAARYVDENFVINEKIDKSLFENASKRVSDAGEIKVKTKKYSGAELSSSDVSKYVASIKRKESIEEFAGYSIDYQRHIKSLLDDALADLNKAVQDKNTSANSKKIQEILQYIDDLKAQFDQFKEIERKIYETYDFGENKSDIKFEDLSSKDNIVETYKKAKEVLQGRLEEIDRELSDIREQKSGIKHYTEKDKTLAKLEFDASSYYSDVDSLRKQLDTKSILEAFKRDIVAQFQNSDYFKGKKAEIKSKYSSYLYNDDGSFKKDIDSAILQKIREEEQMIVKAYEESIRINEYTGTVSYTSYTGKDTQDVTSKVVDQKKQRRINDELIDGNSSHTKKYLQTVRDITAFISELENQLNNLPRGTTQEEKDSVIRALNDAKTLLRTVRSVRAGGDTPAFRMDKSRYEDIIADSTAEEERIVEAEKEALARRAKVAKELADLEENSLGAEALRRASSVRQGESYRSKAASANIDELSAQSVLRESEERLHLLEKEQESLRTEKEKLAEKKKYNDLLIQEKKLKEEIATLEKSGVSSEEKKAELTKLQARITKQEEKIGINFNEVSPSMTKEKAFSMASEYDAQEKLLRSQIKALETRWDSMQELIDNLTARGFNSAKGEAELRRFTNDKVSEFESSDYFRVKKDEIRDKYLKGIYKEDGTIDSSDSLEGKIRELADKYSKDIDKIYFNIADVKEGDAQKFLDALVGDQTRFSNAFKGNRDVGQKFMADYEEFKSFYWELIREEESNIVDDYKKSIKVDKHNGTVSYTSYNGDTIQEVIVDLKSQIIQRLREQIETEIKPILSEKASLLGRVSESKGQALEFAGLKESDIRNADVDKEISSIESKIRDLQNTNLTTIDRKIEDIKRRDLERIAPSEENQDGIVAEIEEYIRRIEKNREQLEKTTKKLDEEKNRYLKEIRKRKGGLGSQEANIALERFKINATNEYLNSDTYSSEVELIKNKYYGKNDSGKSLFEERTSNIVEKYREGIYRVLSGSSKYTEEEIDSFLSLIQNNPELYSSSEAYFKLGKTKNADMVKTLSDSSERLWSRLIVDYRTVRDSIEDSIQNETELLVKKYKDSFVVDRGNDTISYTSYSNGKAENVVQNLRKALLSAIEQEVTDILSGKNVEGIIGDSLGAIAGGVVGTKNNGEYLQRTLSGLIAEKQKIESRIANGTFSEDDQKEIDRLSKEKKAIEDEIAVLEKEIEAWEFVKKAREEARQLDKTTDQERESTELSKIERYEQSISEKKEKQKQLQEELNILRGAEERDVDAIDRKEGELEEVSRKIVELEEKKKRSESKLGRIHERMENAQVSTAGSSGGGILSPIINLLSEIRDILSKISGVPSKNSEGGKPDSSVTHSGKLTSETKSMLSKYWQKKNGKSATKEEWEQLKKDYIAGKLSDLDEVLAQEVQKKATEEKKKTKKSAPKGNGKSDKVIEDAVSVVAAEVAEQGAEKGKKAASSKSKKQKYAGGLTWEQTKEKIKQNASTPKDGLSLEEYITQAQSLYTQVNSWVGEHNIEYFSKRLELGSVMQKAAVAARKENPDKGFKNAEWYKYFAEQYNMKNVNSLVLTARKLGNNKEIMGALADVKPVDTTPVTEAAQSIADNTVRAGAKSAKKAADKKLSSSATTPDTAPIQQAVESTNNAVVESIANASKDISKMSEEEQTERLAALVKLAGDKYRAAEEAFKNGNVSKSKSIFGEDSKSPAQNIVSDEIKTLTQLRQLVLSLADAIDRGQDVLNKNVEYGFTEKNGKKVEFAIGNRDSVYYNNDSLIDSMTHSHAYKKNLNNLMFSLGDIEQMSYLASDRGLKQYNMMYGREMISIGLGKDTEGTALEIADKYPIINDVITAMFSTVNGEDVAAQNSSEMARILNGYLQKVVEQAGGKLSITDIASGENVSDKYSITDDEYSKLSGVVSKIEPYYEKILSGTIQTSQQEYVNVIRNALSQAFGGDFISSLINRRYEDIGGIGAEYSVFGQEINPAFRVLLDFYKNFPSKSKKLNSRQQMYYDEYKNLSAEEIAADIAKLRSALGIVVEAADDSAKQVKPTLTKAQIAALDPDNVSASQKSSIKQFAKTRNWNESNVGNIEKVLGTDNKTLVAYKTQFEELAKIALDLKTKGEAGTIITKDDISQLDAAIAKTKELQSELTKQTQFKQLKDSGLIVSGKTKIKSTDSYSERQGIMEQYAKKYASQNKSEYQFGQYDFINDKISFDMIDGEGQVTKVIMGWSDAFNTAYIQSSKLQGSLDKITQEVYKTDEAIKAGEEYGFFQKQSEGVKAYKDALAEYEAQVKAVSKSSQKDLAQNFEALHTAQEKVINAGKDLLDKQKDAYGFNNAQKVLGRTGDVDAILQNYRDQGINVNDIELVRNYNDAIEALKQKRKALKDSGKLWDSDEQSGLKLLADRAVEAEKALLNADKAQRQLNGSMIQGDKAKFFEGVDVNNVEQVKQAMTQYALSIKGVDAQSIKWNEDQKTLSYSVRTGKREVSDFTVGMRNLTSEFYNARTGARTVKTGMEQFLGSIGDKFKEVGRYLLSFGSFYRIWGEIQKGVTYVKEIDSALTELKKVTDETDATYAQFLKTMSQTGAEVGATVTDLTNMAANWARLGYSIEEAGELAKSTAVLLNVSEFTDADTASEALISTMQAYGYAAEDSMHVVDVLNEIGKILPVDNYNG